MAARPITTMTIPNAIPDLTSADMRELANDVLYRLNQSTKEISKELSRSMGCGSLLQRIIEMLGTEK
jgi:hypothetical protein